MVQIKVANSLRRSWRVLGAIFLGLAIVQCSPMESQKVSEYLQSEEEGSFVEVPDSPGAPSVPEMPKEPELPEVREMPEIPAVPEIPEYGLPDNPVISASDHDGNLPENVVDGSLETRWSALGIGQFLQFDFQELVKIPSVYIAFFMGDQRSTFFEIHASKDKVNYQKVFSGQSSGATRGFEEFKLSLEGFRSIRYVGLGNSSNDWNSLAEVSFVANSTRTPSPDPVVPPPDVSGPGSLTWAPPPLTDPVTINVLAGSTGTSVFNLDVSRDYIINMPSSRVERGLAIVGGRNVVMIGGEIYIPDQGQDPTISSRRALLVRNSTGVVHIEGLLMHGPDISEGLQVSAPNATVQFQNIHIGSIVARDQVGFTDNHPDLIQTWGNVKEMRVDKFTGSTDYQGFLVKSDFNGSHGPVHVKRANIKGDPTARYMTWFHPQSGASTITMEDVFIMVPQERIGGFRKSVYPDAGSAIAVQNRAAFGVDPSGREYATWPNMAAPRVNGRVTEGLPPGGDFVPMDEVGINYVSPGYR